MSEQTFTACPATIGDTASTRGHRAIAARTRAIQQQLWADLEHHEVSRDTLIDLEIATFRAAVAQSLPLPDVADGGPFLP